MDDKKLDIGRFTGEAYRLIDFTEHQFTIASRKTSEEITAELEQKRLDAAHQQRKELLMLYLTFGTVVTAIVFCLWVTGSKGLHTDEGKLAFGAFTTILGTLLGYFTGRAAK